MAIAVRRALKAGVAALMLTGLVVAPAAAGDSSSPDAAYYRSTVSAIQPAVPGLEVSVGAKDGLVMLVNHTGKTVTVVGYGNEDYLRISPSGVEENTNSLTSAINASQSLDKLPASSAAGLTQQPAHWVSRSDQPTASWRDYRVLWTNKQRPPIVADDPHHPHEVFAWAVQLRIGSQPVLVLGDVRWIGTPWLSTLQLVLLGVAVIALLVALQVLIKRRGWPRWLGRRRSASAPVRTRRTAPIPSMRGY